MSKWLYAPSGMAIKCIVVVSYQSVEIEIDDANNVGQGSFDDFPDFESFGLADRHLIDDDGEEYLQRHCRWVEYDHEVFDPRDHQIDPWPDVIIDACAQVTRLSSGLKALNDFKQWMPRNWLDNTGTVAIDTLLKGRIDGEIASLEERIANYRKGRVEIENLNELPGDETQVEESDDA